MHKLPLVLSTAWSEKEASCVSRSSAQTASRSVQVAWSEKEASCVSRSNAQTASRSVQAAWSEKEASSVSIKQCTNCLSFCPQPGRKKRQVVSREAVHKLPLVLSSRLVGERGQLCLEKRCTNCLCSVQPGWSDKEASCVGRSIFSRPAWLAGARGTLCTASRDTTAFLSHQSQPRRVLLP
jgi:hypothetical protein